MARPKKTAETSEDPYAKAEREARWDEIGRLRLIGLSPKQIADELRVSQAAISRQAYKHGNREIGSLFDTKKKRYR